MSSNEQTYGCDDCIYLDNTELWCNLWDVEVSNPHDSHCDNLNTKGIGEY